jgi:hypothetical protein
VPTAPQDLEDGFHLEEPALFVPWTIREGSLLSLLGAAARRVTAGYVTCPCRTLSGLSCQVGFHFSPRASGILSELEFFRLKHTEEKASFDEFQSHLETTFGSPHRSKPGHVGYVAYEWTMGAVVISHGVTYRYMAEEHVRVRRSPA